MKWILLLLFVGPLFALYKERGAVVHLTDENFSSKVIASDQIWIVKFYSPNCGHCKNLVPEYIKAAEVLKGVANVAAIDATANPKYAKKYAIQGYPTIKIFDALDKRKPTEYTGKRTAKGLTDAVKKVILKTINSRTDDEWKETTGTVTELTDANFDRLVINSKEIWMVEFFAPWCGHCQKLEPEWRKAAEKTGNLVRFGALDATVHKKTAEKFNIQGFPTIKFFPPGSSAADAENYPNGRTAQELISFANALSVTYAAAPEVVEATSRGVAMEACREKQLCMFVFLPSIYDCQSKCRKEHIKMLKKLAEKFKGRKYGWLWMEAGAQKDVEHAFGVGNSGYPVLAALNPSKMKYAVQIGSFAEHAIKEFLDSLGYGRARVSTIEDSKQENNFLKLVETPKWDGKDKRLPEEAKEEL
ncbi:unnamed protein product [Caenorhabditis sp. 36 PRJEB53466]|nr:unnamed protein product [Caenorhabditis sp. 36 PRJEB53466]